MPPITATTMPTCDLGRKWPIAPDRAGKRRLDPAWPRARCVLAHTSTRTTTGMTQPALEATQEEDVNRVPHEQSDAPGSIRHA
jgi:hypothetical protein